MARIMERDAQGLLQCHRNLLLGLQKGFREVECVDIEAFNELRIQDTKRLQSMGGRDDDRPDIPLLEESADFLGMLRKLLRKAELVE